MSLSNLMEFEKDLNFFKKIPDTWEIIVYEVLTNPSHTISAKELMEDHVKNKK